MSQAASSDTQVDMAIQKLLTPGARVTHVMAWGVSGWAGTRRITTITPDNEEIEYFTKTISGEGAHDMFRGEFMGLQKLHELMPHACPKPIGWGEYESQPGTFFVMMEFLYLAEIEPSATQITNTVAKIHETTQGTSPQQQCGFYVPTCHGKVHQPNKWDSDWARYFGGLMDIFFAAELETNGPDAVYEEAFALVQSRVVPRLLNALTANGRKMVPVLLHGDLTQKNMGINEETEETMIYDPGMFYGHNEFDIGMWRTSFVPFDDSYRKQYVQRIRPSEPAAEWDDRNRLYSLFFHISHSAHWIGSAEVTRRITLNDMNYLIQKYSEPEYTSPFSFPSTLKSQAQATFITTPAEVQTEAVAALV